MLQKAAAPRNRKQPAKKEEPEEAPEETPTVDEEAEPEAEAPELKTAPKKSRKPAAKKWPTNEQLQADIEEVAVSATVMKDIYTALGAIPLILICHCLHFALRLLLEICKPTNRNRSVKL